MEELKKMLINVPGSYYDFVVAMLNFAKKSMEREERFLLFLNSNPNASASDVIKFASFELDLLADDVGVSSKAAIA